MQKWEPVWQVPEPLSICDVRVDCDTFITIRRHGNPDGPRLLLSHGNGLAIDLYYPFWSLLADNFDLLVHDLRNHGWNTVGRLDRHNVPTMADDHDRILEATNLHFGEKPTVGVFHSVSAMVTLMSPAKGFGYEALILFDPPLCKPGRSYEDFENVAIRTAAGARRRTERFHSLRQLIEVLSIVPIYSRTEPGVWELLARTTLRRQDDGEGYMLRCPREFEAQIVDYASVFAVGINFDAFKCPIKVIGADPTLPSSFLPTMDLSGVMSVDYDFLPDATHFLQLEQPKECAKITQEYLNSIGFK